MEVMIELVNDHTLCKCTLDAACILNAVHRIQINEYLLFGRDAWVHSCQRKDHTLQEKTKYILLDAVTVRQLYNLYKENHVMFHGGYKWFYISIKNQLTILVPLVKLKFLTIDYYANRPVTCIHPALTPVYKY